MNHKKIIEANRKAWNEVLPFHRKGRRIDLHKEFARPGFSVLDEIITAKLKEIGLDGKTVAQPCCNNGRELLSLINLGAKSGVGFDLSGAFIGEANELKNIAGLNCTFIETNVLDIGELYMGKFDMVFITIGALCWLPDLKKFFEIVYRILRDGGDLVIYEEHPFIYTLAMDGDKEYDPDLPMMPVHSYFRSDPWSDAGLDYYGNAEYEAVVHYSFTQKFSDILNPIVKSGFLPREMQEYPHDISNGFRHIENERILPLSYMLHCEKSRI